MERIVIDLSSGETTVEQIPQEEVAAAQAAETARIAAIPYTVNRVSEYPPIGDQLDALFHAGVFPDEMAAKIQAVKEKYPK
jgi:hypothetical protein